MKKDLFLLINYKRIVEWHPKKTADGLNVMRTVVEGVHLRADIDPV